MKDVHYLLMIDLDEYIVPHMNETLQDMLLFLNSKNIRMKSGKLVKTEKLASSYNFKNAFFNSKYGKYLVSLEIDTKKFIRFKKKILHDFSTFRTLFLTFLRQ